MKTEIFRMYSAVSGIGLILGESWFVFTTDKFAPLWLDDYAAAGSLLAASLLWRRAYGPALLLASWAFIVGNLYAMLFTRLEPANPAGRPWMLLAALVVWAGLSTGVALRDVLVGRSDA
ncbi:MAG: hypothetical protein KC502_13685 [Myxococcales bacterium]|nr:hypothetical protein [Myxococcales bacterium]